MNGRFSQLCRYLVLIPNEIKHTLKNVFLPLGREYIRQIPLMNFNTKRRIYNLCRYMKISWLHCGSIVIICVRIILRFSFTFKWAYLNPTCVFSFFIVSPCQIRKVFKHQFTYKWNLDSLLVDGFQARFQGDWLNPTDIIHFAKWSNSHMYWNHSTSGFLY